MSKKKYPFKVDQNIGLKAIFEKHSSVDSNNSMPFVAHAYKWIYILAFSSLLAWTI